MGRLYKKVLESVSGSNVLRCADNASIFTYSKVKYELSDTVDKRVDTFMEGC